MAISVSIHLAWQIWLHCAPQPGSCLRKGLWHPLRSGALAGPWGLIWGALWGKIGTQFFVSGYKYSPPDCTSDVYLSEYPTHKKPIPYQWTARGPPLEADESALAQSPAFPPLLITESCGARNVHRGGKPQRRRESAPEFCRGRPFCHTVGVCHLSSFQTELRATAPQTFKLFHDFQTPDVVKRPEVLHPLSVEVSTCQIPFRLTRVSNACSLCALKGEMKAKPFFQSDLQRFSTWQPPSLQFFISCGCEYLKMNRRNGFSVGHLWLD